MPSLIYVYIFLPWYHSEVNPKNLWMRGEQACLLILLNHGLIGEATRQISNSQSFCQTRWTRVRVAKKVTSSKSPALKVDEVIFLPWVAHFIKWSWFVTSLGIFVLVTSLYHALFIFIFIFSWDLVKASTRVNVVVVSSVRKIVGPHKQLTKKSSSRLAPSLKVKTLWVREEQYFPLCAAWRCLKLDVVSIPYSKCLKKFPTTSELVLSLG